MFALAAAGMGYRVHVFSPADSPAGSPVSEASWDLADVSVRAPYEDLDRVREFAAAVDVVTVTAGDVPLIALRAAAASSLLRPSLKVFEAVESGLGTRRDSSKTILADFSVIGARGATGACVFYDPISIDRVDGVFDVARAPAPIGLKLTRKAIALAQDILEDQDVTGIACVEFTLSETYELTVHDVTPHPHAAGHLTVDASVTSQFEQQLRAVCGLPFGSTQMLRPAAMAVLRASAWESGEPDWVSACTLSEVKLHLHGNRRGHLTATAASGTLAKQIVRAARASLASK